MNELAAHPASAPLAAASADDVPMPSPRQLVLPSLVGMMGQLPDLLPFGAHPSTAQALYVLQQTAQALQVVQLSGAARLLRAMQAALSLPPPHDSAQAEHVAGLLRQAAQQMRDFLQATLDEANAPTAAQVLFEVYRELVRLGGKDTALPVDLWDGPSEPQPTLRRAVLPAQPSPKPTNDLSGVLARASAATQPHTAQMRTQLDALVLELLKTASPEAAQRLSALCLQLAEDAASVALEQFWCVAAAWLQAIAHERLQLDVYAKRLASRLLLQYALQAKGAAHMPEALMRELLYCCDCAARASTQPLPALLHGVCEHSALHLPSAQPLEQAPTTAPETLPASPSLEPTPEHVPQPEPIAKLHWDFDVPTPAAPTPAGSSPVESEAESASAPALAASPAPTLEPESESETAPAPLSAPGPEVVFPMDALSAQALQTAQRIAAASLSPSAGDAPNPALGADIELQSLGAGAAASPPRNTQHLDEAFVERTDTLNRSLQNALQAWVDLALMPLTSLTDEPSTAVTTAHTMAAEPVQALDAAASAPQTVSAVEDPAITLLRSALDALAAIKRSTWGVGWADVSTFAQLVEHIVQRIDALAAPVAQRQRCLAAAAELERLLYHFTAGFSRRAHPQRLDDAQQLLAELAAQPMGPQTHSGADTTADDAHEHTPQTGHWGNSQQLGDDNTDADVSDATASSTDTSNAAALAAPEHFAIFEEELRSLWPHLQSALQQWIQDEQTASEACPPPTNSSHAHSGGVARQTLLRHLHTLKGSARLTGAHGWAAQVHALEERALDHRTRATQLSAPLNMLYMAFMALQQQLAVLHPEYTAAQASAPLEVLQRVGQSLWLGHARAQAAFTDAGRTVAEMQSGLQRLHALVRQCAQWADGLMQQTTALDLPYEIHEQLGDLIALLHGSDEDLGTIYRQLQHSQAHTASVLNSQAAHLRFFQTTLLHAQLVPLDSLQPRLQATLELAARDLGKRAEFIIENPSAKLQRDVAQRLGALLDHLVRNSIAHGIEAPAQRRAAAKPEVGCVTLSLRSTPLTQVITLEDDGAGLNTAAIHARARELGLLPATLDAADAQRFSDAQAAEMIFHPGLSTAATTTAVAGRGIGMDAVRVGVAELGGHIQLESARGMGCRFTIALPAPAYVEQIVALRWQGATTTVAVPAHSVQALLHISADAARVALAQQLLRHQELGPVPLYAAHSIWQDWADASAQPHPKAHTSALTQPVLIVRSATTRWALLVDEVLPTQELIVQPPTDLQTIWPAGFLGTATQPSAEVVQLYDPIETITAYEQRLREDISNQANAHSPADAPNNSAAHIMLVDDSLSVRRLAQHLLSSHGYSVITFADAMSALAHLDQTEPPAPEPSTQDHSVQQQLDALLQDTASASTAAIPEAAVEASADAPQTPDMSLGRFQAGSAPSGDAPAAAPSAPRPPCPDLLFVDIEMPDMSGLDLLRQLRADARWRLVPIVMLTAHEPGPVSHKALELGAQAYLTKPYTPVELLAQVRRYCINSAGVGK